LLPKLDVGVLSSGDAWLGGEEEALAAVGCADG
jgi:hypothetical protein